MTKSFPEWKKKKWKNDFYITEYINKLKCRMPLLKSKYSGRSTGNISDKKWEYKYISKAPKMLPSTWKGLSTC